MSLEVLAEEVRACREKQRLIHEAVLEADAAMREAIAWKEFLIRAYRSAGNATSDAQHRLESEIRSEAWKAVL